MMNLLEESIIYATVLYQGKVRNFGNMPYILHPMEVAQILSTMTDDVEIITAGILHDVVDDTDGTLAEIEKRFGDRVATLVSSESEAAYFEGESGEHWKRRKEESLKVLQNSTDIGVKMLWLADKLANIRSLAGAYSENGEAVWQTLPQSEPDLQRWYYGSIAEYLELSLNKTGAFKELIKHINFIWPGTFDSDKARFKKYREVSIDGCKRLGQGAKGDVYRYDDELVIKVYNHKNTYQDVEREIALARSSFILGIPTAISFGIVAVGDLYGSLYELVDSDTVSRCIERDPGQVDTYAKIMAELALTIHSTEVSEDDPFPPVTGRVLDYIRGGIGREDDILGKKVEELIEALPTTNTLVHGDFHTGNVFLQDGEPILIDMDRISRGHPIVEISDLYYFYVFLGEDEPSVVEKFMGFSYETARKFFHLFLIHYLGTEDEERLREVTEKASLLCYSRMIRKILKKRKLNETDHARIEELVQRTAALEQRLDSLDF